MADRGAIWRQLIFEFTFLVGAGGSSRRGVPGTTWVQDDRAIYDSCLDPERLQAEYKNVNWHLAQRVE